MASDEAISWSVELPQKNKSALGRRRPRARLLIGENETIEIPKAVGARLKRYEEDKREFESRAELLCFVRELSESCAHDRMERLVNFREYSSEELMRKLLDDGYLPTTAQSIVERALEVGVISDTRFCESFIRSKLSCGWGKERIVRELSSRGVDTDAVENMEGLFPTQEQELERACGLARKKRPSKYGDYPKIVRYLVGRGFSPAIASAAARNVLDEAKSEL